MEAESVAVFVVFELLDGCRVLELKLHNERIFLVPVVAAAESVLQVDQDDCVAGEGYYREDYQDDEICQ